MAILQQQEVHYIDEVQIPTTLCTIQFVSAGIMHEVAGIITTLKQGRDNPLPISSIREFLNAALNQNLYQYEALLPKEVLH